MERSEYGLPTAKIASPQKLAKWIYEEEVKILESKVRDIGTSYSSPPPWERVGLEEKARRVEVAKRLLDLLRKGHIQ